MSEFGRRFDPSELGDVDAPANGDAGAAELLAVARDLEAFARSESVSPSVDFEDRVMAAIAAEPPPRAISSGGLLGLIAVVRDSWRLTWTGGRPWAVRAQALALVLLAAVALGSLGSLAVVGVGRLLNPVVATPSVVPAPSPSPTPSMAPSPSPSVSSSPSPTPSTGPTETAEPTDTAEPTETAEPTGNDSSGPGSGSDGDSSGPGSGTGTGSGDDSSGPGSGGDSSGPGSSD